MSSPSMACSPQVVRRLQEHAARALPAERVEHAGGWWLRYSTSAWWAGTVLPHADAGPEELVRRVGGAERFYAGHGTAARFQISPGACPEALDAVLADRGYRRGCPMSLQVAATPHVLRQAPKDPLRVRVDDDPTTAWFDVWHTVHGQGRDSHAEWRMLGRVERPVAYASALTRRGVVAVGRVVTDDGWAGVFGMATLPHARGKGAGRTVLAALADWADGHGADRLYLQVQRDNPPALRLYEGAGFGEVCEYHYRTAGWASAPGTQRSASP